MNFNQFKNLPRIKDLPIQEQNRQWFLYQGNLMYEARSSAIATAASSAAGGRRSTPQPAITFYGLALYTAPLQYKLNGITETGEQVENKDLSCRVVFLQNLFCISLILKSL